MNNPTVVLIYLRSAASDDDAILRQRRACLDHADAKGWVVLDVLADNGAGCLSKRNGFDTLCDRLRARQADVVLTQDPDRLSRDLAALADFLRLCDDHEVRVAFTNGVVIHDGEPWRSGEAPDRARLLAARRKRQIR